MRTNPISSQYNSEYFQRHPFYINHLRRRSVLDNNENSKTHSSPNCVVAESADKKCSERFFMYLRSYCDMTTLHGLRYFAESGRPVYERCFWLFAIVLVLIGMVTTIRSQIIGFINNPILMSLNGQMTPVYDVPFPAITFCSENQVPPSAINISELLETKEKGNLTESEIRYLSLAKMLCHDANSDLEKITLSNYNASDNTPEATMFSSKTCKNSIKKILWRNEFVENPCILMQFNSLFGGFCHTFNGLPPLSFYSKSFLKAMLSHQSVDSLSDYPYKYFAKKSSWSPDTGFSKYEEDIILRLRGGTYVNSVQFLLDYGDDDTQELCMPRSRGFTVIVHNPGEFPGLQHALTYAVVDERTVMHVTPKLVTTDSDLTNWRPKDRGCYYNHERPLMFFSLYTSHNCDAECQSNITFARCKCNLLSQPHLPATPVCIREQFICAWQSLVDLSPDNPDHDSFVSECNCLPACTELSYDMQVTRQPRNWTYNTDRYGIPSDEIKKNSYLSIIALFKFEKVNSIVRVAITSDTDFIANIGGLMGLFWGFSFISVFEIIYFSSIRWMTDTWRRNKWRRKKDKIHNQENKKRYSKSKVKSITVAPRNVNETNWHVPFINNNKNINDVLFVKQNNTFYK